MSLTFIYIKLGEHLKYTSVDLFCGAGGLSLGLTESDIHSIFSADSWKAAVNTFKFNISDVAQHVQISAELKLPKSDVIIGGPPCQGFSSAGMRRSGDKRNTLVGVYSNLIAKNKPKAFVFENVEGFLTSENGDYVLDLLEPLIEAGYFIKLRKINAANYGVPQHRKRVIAIGSLGTEPFFPEPTTLAIGAPGSENLKANLPVGPTVSEFLKDLPKPTTIKGEETISMHITSHLNGEDLLRVEYLREGQTMKDLPEHLWHETFRKRSKRRVLDGTPTEKRGGPPSGIRRLVGNQPSKTITSGARSEFIHPTEDRYLTLRECARLQTFPDDFEFIGTIAEQSVMIGNAVPPFLGKQIGLALTKSIENANTRYRSRGKLLEFIPTLSQGMSPALKTLCSKINSRFAESLLHELK